MVSKTVIRSLLHLVYPPKFPITIVWNFTLGLSVIPIKRSKIEDNAYATFWETNKVYYGKCENGEFKKKKKKLRKNRMTP